MADGWEQQIADNAQRYRQLRERLGRTSITESSRDGMVRVTVSAGGLLTDLVLRDDRHPRPLPEIAAQVMDCVRRAQARIPDLLREALFDTVGSQDPSTHLLLSEAKRRFPEPPPPGGFAPTAHDEPEARDEPVAPRWAREQKPTARRPAAGPEDDWEEPVVLEDV